MDQETVIEKAKRGEIKLEPMKKVLCACQQEPQNRGKPCICKRAKTKRLD